MVYWKTLVRQNNAEQEARDKAISVKAEIDPTPKPKLAEEKQEEVIVSKTATKPKAKPKKKAVKKVEEEEEDDNKE